MQIYVLSLKQHITQKKIVATLSPLLDYKLSESSINLHFHPSSKAAGLHGVPQAPTTVSLPLTSPLSCYHPVQHLRWFQCFGSHFQGVQLLNRSVKENWFAFGHHFHLCPSHHTISPSDYLFHFPYLA